MSADTPVRRRRRFREAHEELKERVLDFNRELDIEIYNYVDKASECHNRTKERIVEAMRVVTDIMKQEDDELDDLRSRALSDIQS
eukprot:6008454-Karenia_brevis.AAC.1